MLQIEPFGRSDLFNFFPEILLLLKSLALDSHGWNRHLLKSIELVPDILDHLGDGTLIAQILHKVKADHVIEERIWTGKGEVLVRPEVLKERVDAPLKELHILGVSEDD